MLLLGLRDASIAFRIQSNSNSITRHKLPWIRVNLYTMILVEEIHICVSNVILNWCGRTFDEDETALHVNAESRNGNLN